MATHLPVRPRIAVVGTGIAGLAAAYRLAPTCDITVFEASDAIGGHTATVDVLVDGVAYAIDTGFIVFNDWTYPNFIALMDELGVASQPSEMGFSVNCPRSGFEYCGSSLNGLFAQRRNLLRPQFWRMLADILRFNREALRVLDADSPDAGLTLGEYLRRNHYSDYFCERYLVPMGAAIWSSSTRAMRDFPLLFFVRFFRNHGLLSVSERPQWRVLTGGSRSYLTPLTASYRERILTSTPVRAIRRDDDGVDVVTDRFGEQRFDQVVIATHADQALALLSDASAAEREVLGAIPYRNNRVVLHTDARVLPRRQRAWASWNYELGVDGEAPAVLTYNMNILQGLNAPHTFCVTLNPGERNPGESNPAASNLHELKREQPDRSARIDPKKILGEFNYAHPVFTAAGMLAQARWAEINGRQRTWFCGAYWHNGFHEDGVVSGLRVAQALGACAQTAEAST
ncbi:MAG: FAD-dependent oxidoreductase [Spongiibacteraceae bacterium]